MNNINKMIKSFILALLILLPIEASALIERPAKIVTDAEYQRKILFYVNEYRAKHHLAPLQMSNAISLEAAKHSENMARQATSFGHNGFNGRINRLYQKNVHCRGGAENVAYYKLDAKQLVAGWIDSRGHRRNIEGNYNITGIGIAHSKKKGWGYFTQIFLHCDNKLIG